MAAVTWKNIAPSNPSGILNSMNTSAAALATAGKGIGDAASGYVDDRQEAETNAFVTDLMAAGSQEERDAMIGAANNSWLDMSSVNSTNYELGAPDREKAAYEQQAATKHYFDKIMAGIDKDNRIAVNAADPSKKTKSTNTNYVGKDRTADDKKSINDPNNDLFNNLEEENTGGFLWMNEWLPFGSDFGKKEKEEVIDFSNSFLEDYAGQISREDLNVAFNRQDIVWKDNQMLQGQSDAFEFTLDGQNYRLDDENSEGLLFEKLMQIKRDEAINRNLPSAEFETQKSKVKSQYFNEFNENNPELLKSGNAEDVFFKFWNDNQDKIDTNKFVDGSESAQIFGLTNKKESNKEYNGHLKRATREHQQMSIKPLETKLARLMISEDLDDYGRASIEAIQTLIDAKKEARK